MTGFRKVRVRFAPSPTGPLHIGGVRTALFNYLFAKKHKGDFILRIEDTDQTRFVPGAEEYIVGSLKWCGIYFDEGVENGGPYGPYRQSERKAMYRQYADKLLESGNAYYAFDTPGQLEKIRKEAEAAGKQFQYDVTTREKMVNSLSLSKEEADQKLQQGEPYVIRFRMPENTTVEGTDLIRGHIAVQSSLLDDKVLFKSDGMPTYHLANVVDDHLMEISHVIRGEEWLPSLPLHIMLYRSFGWEMPEFAHLPLILKPDGKGKLSKRDGDKMGFPVFPTEWKTAEGEIFSGYRESGYLPGAFLNLMALLGWNPGTEQELFSLEEMVSAFSLERVNKSGARFDPEKAKWFNQQYLKRESDESLAAFLRSSLSSQGKDPGLDKAVLAVRLVRERAVFMKDVIKESLCFFEAPAAVDLQALAKKWKPESYGQMEILKNLLLHAPESDAHTLEQYVKDELLKQGLGPGQVFMPLRVFLVGTTSGPSLFDLVVFLGKEEVVSRIDKGLEQAKNL